MGNSDILHGKILQNLSALCETLAKLRESWKIFEKSFTVLGFNVMFLGPKHRFFPLNLD